MVSFARSTMQYVAEYQAEVRAPFLLSGALETRKDPHHARDKLKPYGEIKVWKHGPVCLRFSASSLNTKGNLGL